jgi:hypothetical protein
MMGSSKMSWTEKPIERVDDLLYELITKNQKSIEHGSGRSGYRGHADKTWKLVPSVDRSGPANQDYAKRLAHEACIIDEFRIRTQRFFDDLELRFLAGHCPTVEACAVVQHYGAPTRLLDWSYSPFVALYIAAIEHPDCDGELIWFSRDAFDRKVNESWVKHKCERLPQTKAGEMGQININGEAFRLDAADWISGIDYPLAFPRLSPATWVLHDCWPARSQPRAKNR